MTCHLSPNEGWDRLHLFAQVVDAFAVAQCCSLPCLCVNLSPCSSQVCSNAWTDSERTLLQVSSCLALTTIAASLVSGSSEAKNWHSLWVLRRVAFRSITYWCNCHHLQIFICVLWMDVVYSVCSLVSHYLTKPEGRPLKTLFSFASLAISRLADWLWILRMAQAGPK